MNDFDPYAALKASLRPLRDMRSQWQGFLAVVVVLSALFGYLFIREQGRIDTGEKRIEALEKDVIKLKGMIRLDDDRMMRIDRADQAHDAEIEALKARLKAKRNR